LFFQAEDGIRDLTVTGVQTCALPIFAGIGECVAKELGVSRCGFSRVDVGAGQLTVVSDYHSDLPSLVGVYPLDGQADYLEEAPRSEERRVGKGWRARW